MTKVVSNKKQLTKLVELMECNLDIARGLCSKTIAKSRWEKFAVELNSLGPPSRDWEKWLRVWTDLKFKVKKKTTVNKVEITATGGGPIKLHSFSDLDEAVINLLEIDACLNPPGHEFGLNETSVANVQIEDSSSRYNLDEGNASGNVSTLMNKADEDNLESTERPIQNKNNPYTKREQFEERVVLLRNETSAQKQFYDDISSSVISIKNSLSNIEEFAKITYYLKKEKKNDILQLKKEKLEIYKQHIKNKENYRQAKIKS